MNFCEKCGSLLIPNQKKRPKNKGSISLFCSSCKNSTEKGISEISYLIRTRIPHGEKDHLQVIEEEFSTYPKTRNNCTKCGNHEAYYWEGENRKKEEWESMTYFKCTKCALVWSE